MKKRILISILLTLFTASCGFKVLDTSSNNSFSIKDIKTIGEKRINFKIKNKLLLNTSKTQEKIIVVNLNTIKKKSIKEKNIKNEITKYEISLDTNIKFEEINSKRKYEKTVTVLGDYLISKNTSTTLSNERKLIENLADQISDQIMETISLKLNDN